ncbi:phage tail fiber protein [Paenibacillus endoradicis]|uniref:phage tail fiber protein n=1 Tax=Paenibacillus endoradicis TaxID=2972487 RepID=UPI0021597422|nr:hypothetical protein [Paenibacillus endoradicis]MCR8656927.1 hypothetical protein [Paenibacillus endoradicis]
MTLAVSNYLADKLLNGVFRGQAYTFPATVYIALYTSNPTAADTGSEVSGGGYVRKSVTFSAPVTENAEIYHPGIGALVTVPRRTIKSSAEIVFPVATANWNLITHVAIRDALTGGNLLYYGAVTNPKTISVSDIIKFPVGDVVLTLN